MAHSIFRDNTTEMLQSGQIYMLYTNVLQESIIQLDKKETFQLLMLFFTAYGKGRVEFSYVCHYPWMRVVGEPLVFPSSWIPSHVWYRARLGCIPELPLCLAPCFGICLSFWAVSSHWFLVPLHVHLLSSDSDWNCFILSFYSAFDSVGSQGQDLQNQNHC